MIKNILIIYLIVMSAIVQAEVIEIGNKELASLMSKKVPIIDIRRKEEWQKTGVLIGSNLITFFDKNGESNVKKWLKELEIIASKDQPFILICRTGRRTGIVAKFLSQKLGYEKVYDVKDGITEWINKGNYIINP